MNQITWQVTDRMNRIWMWFSVVMALLGLVPLLWDLMTTLQVLWCGLMLIQAWYYWRTRKVTGTIDATGIHKQLGNEKWTARWEDIAKVDLKLPWRSFQLVVSSRSGSLGDWGFSNKLLGVRGVPRDAAALQIDPTKLADIQRLLARHRVPLGR